MLSNLKRRLLEKQFQIKILLFIYYLIALQWIPGHCQMAGKEQADALVKKGAKITQTHIRETSYHSINSLTPNDLYMGRTTPLTSKSCILYIYSTNIGTEYFKHALNSPVFFLFKMQFVS